MAQTVFTNLYLHDPSKIEDRVLKAFCVGVLKLVAICKEVITTTAVYEDEHFQPSAHGFHLADSISEQRTLGKLICFRLHSLSQFAFKLSMLLLAVTTKRL